MSVRQRCRGAVGSVVLGTEPLSRSGERKAEGHGHPPCPPQRWPRHGSARGRAAPRCSAGAGAGGGSAVPALRAVVSGVAPWGGRAGKWIAIPATSSSGCNWSCAPWPSCSPEVRPRRGTGESEGEPRLGNWTPEGTWCLRERGRGA